MSAKSLSDIMIKVLDKVSQADVPQKGEIITGTVVEKTKDGILVDVGWKSEGIILGKELRSETVDVNKLSIGDDVLVYVVSPENDDGQLVLSLRKTDEAKRWLDLRKAKEDGIPVEVEVVEANSGGVICDLGGDIRGFIPTMQIDSSRIFPDGRKLMGHDVSSVVQERLAGMVGEKLKVGILELDMEKGRIILSEKAVTQARELQMRERTLKRMKVGDVLAGEVSGITPFGIFVNANGVEGLVHLSELSWDKVEDTGALYKVGDKVKVQVIDISDGGRRVAYSIKRLQEDPWKKAIKGYKVGDIVEGTVQKIVDYGFFVRIGPGLNGLVHISEISYGLVRNINNFVKVGQKVKVKILSISSTERHLRLSLKRAVEKPNGRRGAKIPSEINNKVSSTVATPLSQVE